MSDEQIVDILEKLRLSHLSGLIQSYDTVYGQEWSKFLSPGEQQRLVFARVLFWNPRFAGNNLSSIPIILLTQCIV